MPAGSSSSVPPSAFLAGGMGWRSIGALVLLGVLWGTTFPMVRLGVDAHAEPFLLLSVGLFAAALGTVPIAWRRPGGPGDPRSLAVSAGLGVVLIGGNNLFLFWALQYTTGGLAAIVYATIPLLSVGVVAASGARERISPAAGGALALGLGGVIVLGVVSTGTALVGNGWAIVALFGGATAQAVGAVLVMRYRPRGEGPAGQAAQFAGAGAASLLVAGAVGGAMRLPVSAPVLASLAYFVGASAIAGYLLFFGLIRRLGPVGANLVTYVNPLVALAVGILALGEAFAPTELLGLALVLGALALLEWSGRRGTAAGSGRRPGVAATPPVPGRTAPP